ncbi:hypothetical protein DFA_00524 [Cavenderia fasciculata]|uniref:ComC supersandwich domain-containing protein n=1 Tax=Cavenderia fasciculata TaxID=261658 RepID=F4PSB7_CACFS|nr:uncharacterized protein DFA_00524 [Cavenderia fasciculata]EGG20663.1 hypothetical protein DFA_00524 [Cavenderia fasciculata]|eukprot:XP_004358513.1 hypothetical protein DFA_00524 [Cavenderia fasciculata]
MNIDSVIFILRQYGSTIGQTEQDICNSTQIQCIGDYVNSISLKIDQYQDVGPVNSSIQSLDLFLIRSIEIYSSGQVNDRSINLFTILNLGVGFTTSILIKNDPSFTTIPSIWARLNNFVLVDILDCPLTDYSPLFKLARITYITIQVPDSVSGLTFWTGPLLSYSLTTITISALNLPNNLNITTEKFASLGSVTLKSSTNSIITVYMTGFGQVTCTNSANGGYNLIIQNQSIPFNLAISGKSTIEPPISRYYTNLFGLNMENVTGGTYPLFEFPPSLKYLRLVNSLFGIWNLTVPDYVESLVLTKNGLTSLDWSLFDQAVKLNLDVSNNPLLGGPLPESMCYKRQLIINNTLFTQSDVPMCYWCYIKDTIKSPLTTDLIPPTTNLTYCKPKVDTPVIITRNGGGRIIGRSLGFGMFYEKLNASIRYSLDTFIPTIQLNLQFISPQLKFYGPPQPINLMFSPFYPDSFVTKIGQNAVRINSSMSIFNDYLPHTIMLNSTIPCPVTIQTSKYIVCQTSSFLQEGALNFTLSNQYSSNSISIYNNNSVPLITSVAYNPNNRKNVTIYGEFGKSVFQPPTAKINDSIPCYVITFEERRINCLMASEPTSGVANISVTADYVEYIGVSMLYFSPPPRSQSQCQAQTLNCHGHGQCNINGLCECEPTYNQNDDCKTRFTNGTIFNANSTSPKSSFDIDGITFAFELASIQELNIDGNVLKELLTSNWTFNLSKSDDLTLAVYTLQQTDNFQGVEVVANISFSSQAREVPFGTQILQINPNSIKIAVSVSNWNYTYVLSTLQVVFRSVIDNSQLGDGCGDNGNEFTYDQYGSTLQYLRVVKDNVQFSGRFIDFALSDGRPTFSRTKVINQTSVVSDSSSDDGQDLSIIMIGIGLPQCRQCVLDPDFTPLLIDQSQQCNTQSKEKWGVIVGSVVGAVAGAALLVAVFVVIKKTINSHQFLQNVNIKLGAAKQNGSL